MKNFDVPYVDNNTYPKRLDDCLESLCQQAGLVLGSKNFPNNSYMIKGNPFTNGETRKTVLSNLVQLTGGFAEVDIEDGKLYVRNLDVSGEPVETIDGNNYDEFKPNNVFGPVNSIRLLMNSSVEGEETIKEADGVTDENRCQITIADNYYLTSAEERKTVINGIFNALNGLTYLPVEINYYGYPWLKLGSKIKVKDKNDNEYITYVMEHTLKYNGAYSGKIKATALTKTQVAYKETTSLKQFKRNTELAVDKINGKITEIIEEQSDQSNKLVQIEKDINGVTTKVSSVETQVNNITNTQAQAEGKNIHIEDSAEEPFVDISLHGESTQKTRSGKNLAILGVTSGTIGEVPFIVDKGTININGTTISGDANYYFNSFRVSNNGVATFWIEITGYTDKLSNQAGILLQESSDNSTWSTTKGISCKSTATKQYQVTLDNSKYYRIRFYTKENTFTNVTIKIQLEYGTNKTEFEEAGASPSPDYPSEIENIEGKNKFDYESAINVENLTYDNTYAFFEIKNIKPNTAYTISNLKLTDLTNLGYSVYAGLTIGNTYSTGPGKAFHCCIYNNVYKNGIGVVTGYSDTKANGGKLYFCIATTNTNEDLAYERFIKICSMVFDKAQIEEGTEATPYVPYNSLEFKVEGKNRFDKSKDFSSSNISKNLWTITQLENGLRVMSNYSDGMPYIRYIITDLSNFIGKTIRAKANFVSSSANKGAYRLSICNADGTNPTVKKFTDESNKEISFIVETLEEGKNFLSFELYSNFTGGTQSPTAYVDYTDIIVTIDDEDMTYEPYKSQVETFPLAKGQKLMKRSYLASDGINHTRKQVEIDVTQIRAVTSYNNIDYASIPKPADFIGYNNYAYYEILCNKAISQKITSWDNTENINKISSQAEKTKFYLGFEKGTTLEQMKTALANTVIEYDLAEEETVPYTAEQQEAWNKIKAMYTYKNITNITSDAYAKIIYMRDNGLDVYETKQNASKNYTKTSTEIQQLDDSIKRTISQIGDRSQKTTTVTEDIDGIKNEVSKIQDLTQTTSGTKTIALSNCAKGDLLSLKIKGNNTVFKYLYPSEALYPTDDLYPAGDSRILVNDIQYELGVLDTLRQNGEVYDEFVLENGQAKVIRRINADGTIKASETIENLGTFNIPLNEGTNTIKIKNYSAEIGAKYVVKSDYTEAFATKLEMNSSIEQTAEKIESKVSKTYETLEDARTQYSNIKQTTNEISTQVVKKVGKNEIISSVNQSAEQIQIEADKININGTVSANGNFKVDTNGNMECNNGKFNGGTICLKGGTRYNTKFKIIAENGDDNTSISPTNIFVDSDDGGLFINGLNNSYQQKAYLYTDEGDEPNLYLYAANKGTTRIKPSGIKTPTLTQTSKAESKKNFENLSIEEAKKILNNTEIYKYNLKTQEDNDKKYIGFVIGDDYNYAEEITSENNDGANIYSMTSVLYTVVQEQQKQINQLQEKIEKLEGGQDK